ncbi:hypothetical protein ACI2KR_12710 [Pseudomonas luteola]
MTYAVWSRGAQRAADPLAPGSALSTTGVFGADWHSAHIGAQLERLW